VASVQTVASDCIESAQALVGSPLPLANGEAGRLAVTVLRRHAELEAFYPEWQALVPQATGTSYANDPDHVRYLLASHADWAPLILVARRHGRVECVAPLHVRRKVFRLQLSALTLASIPVRQLELLGDDFLFRRGAAAAECVAAIFDKLQQQARHFDLAFLAYPPCAGALWQHCLGGPGAGRGQRLAVGLTRTERVPQLELTAANHDAYMASLNANTRAALRRNARRILKDGRGEFLKITQPQQVASFLDQLDEVYRKSWQAKVVGYYPRNAEPERRHLEELAARGWLRAYLLRRDQQPVAYELAYQYGGVVYGTECGFDPEAAALGPGMVLIHLMIEDLFQTDRPRLVDFGFGDAAYKRSFANSGYEAGYLHMAFSSAGRQLLALQQALDTISAQGRKVLTTLRLEGLVRRLLFRQRRWSAS
jgi:CelD/BcsL family acetyltransferase involved in cellulose biosynthesis